MKKFSRKSHHSLNELNVTPLLDLVFSLLIIFIITTPQMMNNLEMALPSGQPIPPADPTAPPPQINRIVVEADGRTYLNEELLTVPLLKVRLERLKATDPDTAVVVQGADEVDYQHMIDVLDVLQQLEIRRVGLATVDTDGGSG
ncbi:MAG: biopolymer transporter ExbD [Verrucomicrobiae bacterium]|nr:biopolymer transporter ExbD [Verrucomicrobiae bacterium]